MKQDMIVILDLGSEENPRLAREIRALGVYSEIHPHDLTLEQLKALPNVKGVILNGGPNRAVGFPQAVIADVIDMAAFALSRAVFMEYGAVGVSVYFFSRESMFSM